jgi:hypothetical protein
MGIDEPMLGPRELFVVCVDNIIAHCTLHTTHYAHCRDANELCANHRPCELLDLFHVLEISSFDFHLFLNLKYQLMNQSIHDPQKLFDNVVKLLDQLRAGNCGAYFIIGSRDSNKSFRSALITYSRVNWAIDC